MLFTILIYGVDAQGAGSSSPEEDEQAILQRHRDLQARLRAEGRFRGAVRLMPASTAKSVQGNGVAVRVLDGPFAESKEQIVGFYLIDVDGTEEAIAAARALSSSTHHLEVRPVSWAGGL